MQSSLQKIFGIVCVGLGAVMIGGFSVSATEKGATFGDIVMVVVVGILPILGGIFLYRDGRKKASIALQVREEQTILRIAASNGGLVTATTLAQSAGIRLTEAERTLDDLYVRSNILAMEEGEPGQKVYRVLGFSGNKPRLT